MVVIRRDCVMVTSFRSWVPVGSILYATYLSSAVTVMVSGDATAPAGTSIVKPVSGIDIRPPDWSIRCETLTWFLGFLLHHRAWSSRSAAFTLLTTPPEPRP